MSELLHSMSWLVLSMSIGYFGAWLVGMHQRYFWGGLCIGFGVVSAWSVIILAAWR